MANPVQHAKNSEEETYSKVQPYMAGLFQRLAINYAILIVAAVLVNTIGVRFLLTFLPIPQSTSNVIGFIANLFILLYGWRFLENRNHATALFTLYTLYSRQRRDLKADIELAENGALENTDTLYIQVDVLEERANNLIESFEQEKVKVYSAESKS